MKYAFIILAVIVGVFIAASLTPNEAKATIKRTPVDVCPFAVRKTMDDQPNCVLCHFVRGGLYN